MKRLIKLQTYVYAEGPVIYQLEEDGSVMSYNELDGKPYDIEENEIMKMVSLGKVKQADLPDWADAIINPPAPPEPEPAPEPEPEPQPEQ